VRAQSHAMKTPGASREPTQVNTPHASLWLPAASPSPSSIGFGYITTLLRHRAAGPALSGGRSQPFFRWAQRAQGLCGAVVLSLPHRIESV
jgi:hypothetical protein